MIKSNTNHYCEAIHCDAYEVDVLFNDVANQGKVGSGEYIDQNIVTSVGDARIEWFVGLYLNGCDDSQEDEVLVRFSLSNSQSKCTNIEVHLTATLKHSTNSRLDVTRTGLWRVSKGDDLDIGSFITYHDLMKTNSGYVLEGKNIIFNLKLRIFSVNDSSLVVGNFNDWWSGFSSFENDVTTSDFKIKAGDQEFLTHKIVLAFRSDVFKAMFQSEMKETTNNELKIEEFNAEIVQSMLKCLYDPENALKVEVEKYPKELLSIFHKYQMDRFIKNAVYTVTHSIINVENVLEWLLFADQMDFSDLKENAINTIAENASKLLVSEANNTSKTLGLSLTAEILAFVAENCTFSPLTKKKRMV